MAVRHIKINRQFTRRDEASLDRYLREIAKVELLTPDEEAELAKRIKNGDKAALNKLTTANLRFVISVSKQYQHQGLSLPDLINEGNLGLIKAAYRFDHSRGFKFISYAVWWIRQSILAALSEQSRIVRLPSNKSLAITRVNQGYARLEQEFQREPTASELSMALKLSEDEVSDSIQLGLRPLSMDAPLGSGEEHSVNLYDVLCDEDAAPEAELMNESLKNEVERFLHYLKPRDAQILRLFFGLNRDFPLSLDEISEKVGLTPERVRQVKDKSIQSLKFNSDCRILRTYMS
jgi:RNA polymerase primary sigma factor